MWAIMEGARSLMGELSCHTLDKDCVHATASLKIVDGHSCTKGEERPCRNVDRSSAGAGKKHHGFRERRNPRQYSRILCPLPSFA